MIIFCVAILFILFVAKLLLAISNVQISKGMFTIINLITIIIVMFMGFHTVPYPADDLTRYNAEMDRIKDFTLQETLKYGVWKETVISTLVLFVVSKIGVYGLIPMFFSVAMPMVFYYLIKKQGENDTINIRTYFILEIFVWGFCEVYLCASAFRQTLAMFAGVIVIYLDSKGKLKNKILKWILYLLLPFIHTSMIIVVAVAILVSLIKSPRNVIIVELAGVIGINLIISILSLFKIPIISAVVDKYFYYMGEYSMATSLGIATSSLISALCIIYLSIRTLRTCKTEKTENNSNFDFYYNKFILACLLLLLFMYPVTSALFYRLYPMIVVLITPVMYKAICKMDSKILFVTIMIILSSLVRFVFQYLNYFSIWAFAI